MPSGSSYCSNRHVIVSNRLVTVSKSIVAYVITCRGSKILAVVVWESRR